MLSLLACCLTASVALSEPAYEAAAEPSYLPSPSSQPLEGVQFQQSYSPSSSYAPSASRSPSPSPSPAPKPIVCACGPGVPFPPSTAGFAYISGDVGCSINYISFFNLASQPVFTSGNASARSQPFSIACPGSYISEFQFTCTQPGSPYASAASLQQLGRVLCASGAQPVYTGLGNVCQATIGTAYANPADGTCSRCAGSGVCPPPGMPRCDLQRCVMEPSPLDAPWPMLGRDTGRRSTSPYPGPASGLQRLFSTPAGQGAQFQGGATVDQQEALFASRAGGFPASLGAVKLAGGAAGGGRVIWSSAIPATSTSFTLGPWRTLLGSVSNTGGQRAATVLSADTGSLLGVMGGSITVAHSALQEVSLDGNLNAWALAGPPPAAAAESGESNETAAAAADADAAQLPYLGWTPPYYQAQDAALSAGPAQGAAAGLLLPCFFNGTIFHAGATPNELAAHAYTPTGGPATLLWRYSRAAGSPALSSLLLSWDGQLVYFGDAGGGVTCLSAASGELLWATALPGSAFNGALSALSTDGQLLFLAVGGGSRVANSSASGEEGGVEALPFAGVVALHALSGNRTWSLPTAAEATALALDGEGRLYVGDAGGSVYTVQPGSGAVTALYKCAEGGIVRNGLALGGQGVLYAAATNGLVGLQAGAEEGEGAQEESAPPPSEGGAAAQQ